MVLGLIGGLLGGLGGLFGNKSSSTQTEEFERDTNTKTRASAQDLSPELLAALEGLFMSQLSGGGFDRATEGMDRRLAQLLEQSERPEFDVQGFAQGISDQATAGARMDLDRDVNNLLSAVGGSASGNTMASLLANQLQNNTTANLAGVMSKAVGEGEMIRQSQQGQLTEGIAGLSGGLSQQILGLIQATRGASQTGESETDEHTTGRSTIKQSGKSGGGIGGFLKGIGSLIGGARGNA